MAEVLGIIASGISIVQIAGQAADCIIKLKEHWRQIREAPDDIKQLLLEIDSLNLILHQIQDDQARKAVPNLIFDNLCVRQCIELCSEGTRELHNLVNDMAEKIDGKRGWRRQMGSIKVVLKKEEVKQMKHKMKNAIRLLSLAYQCYTK
jgi:hypothetical protein